MKMFPEILNDDTRHTTHTPKSPNIRGLFGTPRMFGDLGVCCRLPALFLFSCLLILLALSAHQSSAPLAAKGNPLAQTQSSLLFIENVGQFEPSVRFQVMGGKQPLWLTESGIWLTLLADDDQAGVHLNLQFVGASSDLRLEPIMPLETVVSYYQGKQAEKWHRQVPVWGGVRYANLYPGIDLEISSQDGEVVQRFVAGRQKQHQARSAIRLQIDGADIQGLSQNKQALELQSPLGLFTIPLPSSSMAWQLVGRSFDGRTIELDVPAIVTAKPQVSHLSRQAGDGPLRYGSYLGGAQVEQAYGIAYDAQNNLYLAGHTQSTTFPAKAGVTHQLAHNVDAFAAKMNPTQGTLDYLLVFRGSVEEFTQDIKVDEMGQAYIVGRTDSTDFPTTGGAYDTTHSGVFDFDGFVGKVSAEGALLYLTLLGDSGLDYPIGLELDALGNTYVTGGTLADDFPVTSGAYNTTHNGGRDIFLSKINPTGSALLYSTFVGGSSQDQAEAIALDSQENVYLTGWSTSADFPTTRDAYQSTPAGGFDAFAVKLNLSKNSLDYGTFLGGAQEDRGFGIAVDDQGLAYIGGSTKSITFPTTEGSFDTTLAGEVCQLVPCADGFVVKLASDGQSLAYGAYLGGKNVDQVVDIAIDENGAAYLTGLTRSSDFFTTADAYERSLNSTDAFIVKVNSSGSTVDYATFLGGGSTDDASSIAVDQTGLIYLAGRAKSPDFPTTPNASAPNNSGDYDAFAVIFDPTILPINKLYLPLLMR